MRVIQVSPIRALGVVLVATVLVISGGCSKTGVLSAYSPEDDAKKMQGSWKLTAATFNGQAMVGEAIGDTRLTINGDKYVMTHNGIDESSTFTLGTGGPHTIRVFHHENPLASQGFYGGTVTGIFYLLCNPFWVFFLITRRQNP